MFIFEFKFSFLRDLNIELLQLFIGHGTQMVFSSMTEFLSVSFFMSLLFGFMMTLPFADYFWHKYDARVSKPSSPWRLPLMSLMVFISGLIVATLWQYQFVHSLHNALEVEPAVYDIPKLLIQLIKAQWLFVFAFLIVWFVLRRRNKADA